MPARLTQIRIRNFKSIGPEEQAVDLKPLTVLIGLNNSGKSTVIQSLLLLKQTLEDPRPEVQLALQGNYIRATSLRELTHGWPEEMEGKGPELTLRWISEVPEPGNGDFDRSTPITSELQLHFRQRRDVVGVDPISRIVDVSQWTPDPVTREILVRQDRQGGFQFAGSQHFLPHAAYGIEPDISDLFVAFELLYKQPLLALRELLLGVGYVSSDRAEHPPYFSKPTSVPSKNVLAHGGNAPELLYGRQADTAHLAALADMVPGDGTVAFTERVTARPLKEAVAEVLRHLGIDADISFSDVQQLGLFRLLFGRAPLNHVGRGIGQVLPVIVAGLVADPLLGLLLHSTRGLNGELSRSRYLELCKHIPTLALEELESHLHPKAQSRLTHFLVALARTGRQLIVETHSDHLVRRLRRLVAQTAPGSESERWLLENVNIVEVEQSDGVTRLRQAQLTREGSIEQWPSDFMDESANEERAIHFAALDKTPPEPPPADAGLFEDVPAGEKG